MGLDAMLAALEGSTLAEAIRNSLYVFPLIESCHVIGLGLVFGTIVIVDLRLLGAASASRPYTRVAAETLTYTWWAFGLTVATGALMFITNATVYAANTSFRVKMLLLVLSGLNVAIFQLTSARSLTRWDEQRQAPPAARAAAAVSLLLWLSIIVAGRWIGFTTTRASFNEPDIDIEQLMPK